MESQESQQAVVSVTEFNEIKNEFRNLTHLMTMMMNRLENQNPPSTGQDSGSPQGASSNEAPNIQTQSMHIPSVNSTSTSSIRQLGGPTL